MSRYNVRMSCIASASLIFPSGRLRRMYRRTVGLLTALGSYEEAMVTALSSTSLVCCGIHEPVGGVIRGPWGTGVKPWLTHAILQREDGSWRKHKLISNHHLQTTLRMGEIMCVVKLSAWCLYVEPMRTVCTDIGWFFILG